MRIKYIVFTSILGFLTINNLNAQSIGGNSLSILAPTSTLGDVYDVGLGLYGNLEISTKLNGIENGKGDRILIFVY